MLALSAHLTGLFLEDTRLQILSPKGKHIYFSIVAICSVYPRRYLNGDRHQSQLRLV